MKLAGYCFRYLTSVVSQYQVGTLNSYFQSLSTQADS